MSVDADHETLIELVVVPVATRLLGAVGAMVSLGGGGAGQAPVGELTLACAERLPAASYASTASV